jgi:hypothetical protein
LVKLALSTNTEKLNRPLRAISDRIDANHAGAAQADFTTSQEYHYIAWNYYAGVQPAFGQSALRGGAVVRARM